MAPHGLTIYKSSAGSGKTYTLVREYLAIVLKAPTDFKHTLAITFTNKATQEMKSRIIKALTELAEGKENSLKEDLQKRLPEANIMVNAQMALDLILHDYSRFAISTIDSFFHRIIRALARELHLPIRFDIEMDQDTVVDSITESLMEEAGNDEDLTRWLQELVLMKMEDDKGWKVDEDIKWVANELFTETFNEHTLNVPRETLRAAIIEMRSAQIRFIKEMQHYGREALKIIVDNGLGESDFYQGAKGVFGYFKKIGKVDYKSTDIYTPNTYVKNTFAGSSNWHSSKTSNKTSVGHVGTTHLYPILNNILNLYETGFEQFVTSREVLKYIYISGIVSDLSRKLRDHRNENNIVFISDAPKILSNFLTADDTSFIYEKFGSLYKHFLIDEFQDTSTLQWKNILPLITESIGSGHSALVVGDVKQSIYRWRGGNMQLLNTLRNDLPQFNELIAEEKLSTNYRSRKLIIDFNNEFFTNAAQLINNQLKLTDENISTLAYNAEEVKQASAPHLADGGLVSVKFYSNDDKSEADGLKWKEKAIHELVSTIKKLLESGCEPKDIAILVRKNLHGNEIASHLFENGIKKVISPDSLLLDNSIKINFLLSVLRFLADQSDKVAKTELLYSYSRYHLNLDDLHDIFKPGESKKRTKHKEPVQPSLFDLESLKDDAFNRLLPPSFTDYIYYLSKLPLYELVEQMISIFSLNNNPDAYLQRFQDVVLEQTIKKNISIAAFLVWWEENWQNISVIVPENENAITIMTIHKSKGLQFPVVLIPWMEWTLGPNQKDLLWVNSNESPYDRLEMIPVKPTKALLNTVFKEQYEEELINNYIDNLNLMYVAMTRAEEQLYIYCEDSKEEELKNVTAIVKKSVANGTVLKPATSEENDKSEASFQAGELKPVVHQGIQSAMAIENYLVNRWQEKISISSKAHELKNMMKKGVKEKINFGILVHRVLSEIKEKEEIDEKVENIFFEGILTEQEKEELKKEIINYFAIEGIDLFYDKSWNAVNEKEILLPGGELLRPDRVLIKDHQAMVIDFKTGRPETSHSKQVRRYAETLLSMGFEDVRSFLIYINDKKVTEVSLAPAIHS